jgi:hypothetical protein
VNAIELLQSNLLSPMVLAFVLGAIAVWVRSDLSFPAELYTGLSIFLLLAIGLRGGHELAAVPLASVAKPAAATLLLGVVVPLLAYVVLRRLGRFDVSNAAALAAHYGSVSAVTFAATLTFLESKGVTYEGYAPALVALLEVPAIIVALLIARRTSTGAGQGETRGWGPVLHEVLAGRSVLLMIGGLLIGYVSTAKNFDRVAPVFVNLFYGALVLFLLDMGMVAARRMREVGSAGLFLIGFAVLAPLFNGVLGVFAGHYAGLSFGGTVILGVMAASASYIAAPAAVRIALPEANPGYYLTASIGITFPFNLTIGIPAIYALASWVTRS